MTRSRKLLQSSLTNTPPDSVIATKTSHVFTIVHLTYISTSIAHDSSFGHKPSNQELPHMKRCRCSLLCSSHRWLSNARRKTLAIPILPQQLQACHLPLPHNRRRPLNSRCLSHHSSHLHSILKLFLKCTRRCPHLCL